ncbi:MAG: protein translocase subunit SecD, partial [Phycisphaerae bacterium]|nr:protein translocase subunit SecD [Phycisphaerae bacterium]
MTGKYLPLKFIFVALLVALCLGSIFYMNGLVYGPDIAGGNSMTFRVESETENPHLIEQVIAILKKRVDPQGLSSIEWRPLKNNCFEVRMPAARKKSREFSKAYFDAREKLLSHNITRANIRNLRGLTQQQRHAQLSKLLTNSGGTVDEKQIDRIETLLKDAAALDAKEKALVALNASFAKDTRTASKVIAEQQKQQQAAKDAISIAHGKYLASWKNVLAGNINVNSFDAILRGYNIAIQQGNNTDKDNAFIDYDSRLDEFCRQHTVWKNGIMDVAGLYRKWSDVRRPLEDPSDLKKMIQQAGILEFRIAPQPRTNQEDVTNTLPKDEIKAYQQLLEDEGPKALQGQGKDYAWYPVHNEDSIEFLISWDYHGQTYVLLSNKAGQKLLRPGPGQPKWALTNASVGSDQFGAAAVNFKLDSAGASQFAMLTKNNLKRPMAILLDDEMYSAPNIQSMISGSGQITGRFTYEEVKKLAQTLAAGSLRGKIDPNPISETAFSAALGEINIEKGKKAAAIGLIAVAVFMLIYYLLCGAIANFALLLNIILIIGAMSIFRAVLTLPGIAGIILTIGIAVDANVLIFERLREEQAAGFGVKQALKNAYERAFSAIIDANITTLLICLFLFFVFGQIGMQEVRGFAITLGLGVVFSMFTALVVTRWVFEA